MTPHHAPAGPELFRIYFAVDEKGNLGKSLKGDRFYTIVGSVVVDRQGFEDVSKRYALERGREIKYYLDPDLHGRIIEEAAPYVRDVYFVRFHKDSSRHNFHGGLTSDEKADIHIAMLQALADVMVYDMEWGPIDVEVDYSRLVAGRPVKETYECNVHRDGREIECKVVNSSDSYGLMTHDFIAGAVGDRYSDPGDSVAKSLVGKLKRPPKEVHLRSKNHKSRRFWR